MKICGPNIVNDSSLQFNVDAANIKSLQSVATGWNDLKGNYGNLTVSGGTLLTEVGGCISFDGLLTSRASTINTVVQTDNMTWDVWINRTVSQATYNMIFAMDIVPYLSFNSNNQFTFAWITNYGSPVQTNIYTVPTYSNNVWYNVTCTLTRNSVTQTSSGKIYVNGINVTTTTVTSGSSTYPAGVLRIGNFSTGQWSYNGKISNLKIYNRILTDAEILQNYNALRTRFGHV